MFKKTAETITEEPVVVQFQAHVRHKWMPWKKLTVHKQYEIRPLNLGSIVRISKLLLSIDSGLFKLGNNLVEVNHELAAKHGNVLAQIVAIAFTNTKQPPADSLVELIEHNVTPADLLRIFSVVLEQMDISNFMTSIISIRGINLLKETNPTEQGSTNIASGE